MKNPITEKEQKMFVIRILATIVLIVGFFYLIAYFSQSMFEKYHYSLINSFFFNALITGLGIIIIGFALYSFYKYGKEKKEDGKEDN